MQRLLVLILMITTMEINAQDFEQTNQHFSHTQQTTGTPEQIWEVWTNVDRWKDWDTGLQDAELHSETFELGAKGTILSLEGRKSKFTIVEFERGRSYTMKTKLPLGSLYVKRYLTSAEGHTIFTHEVWFSGLTKGIFAKAFGTKFRNMLPDVLANIKNIVEK